MQLIDGTGSRYTARVDVNHNLHTKSNSSSLFTNKALEGKLYVTGSELFSVTTTEGLMGWVYWADTQYSLAISRIAISWNGGNTNHNRALKVCFRAGDGPPTTNMTTLTARNANTSSSLTFNGSLVQWNGNGTGMTGHSAALAQKLSNNLYSQGTHILEVDGRIIIGPQATLSMAMEGEEAGLASFSIWLAVIDVDLD